MNWYLFLSIIGYGFALASLCFLVALMVRCAKPQPFRVGQVWFSPKSRMWWRVDYVYTTGRARLKRMRKDNCVDFVTLDAPPIDWLHYPNYWG